jgi:hypothetical protein
MAVELLDRVTPLCTPSKRESTVATVKRLSNSININTGDPRVENCGSPARRAGYSVMELMEMMNEIWGIPSWGRFRDKWPMSLTDFPTCQIGPICEPFPWEFEVGPFVAKNGKLSGPSPPNSTNTKVAKFDHSDVSCDKEPPSGNRRREKGREVVLLL